MTETITDRVADMDSTDIEDSEAKEIVESVVVENNNVFVVTLKQNRYKVGQFRSIASSNTSELINEIEEEYDIIVPDDTRNKIQELVFSIKKPWDKDIKMFRLDYELNSYGQINKFFVPFNSEFIDNTELFKIYNEEGDFVAKELEDYLGKDISKIGSSDLYVKRVPENEMEELNVYRKVRQDKMDLYEDAISNETPFDSTSGAIREWIQGFLITISLSAFHFLFGLSILFVLFITITFPQVYIKLFRVYSIPVQILFHYYKSRKNAVQYNKEKFFGGYD